MAAHSLVIATHPLKTVVGCQSTEPKYVSCPTEDTSQVCVWGTHTHTHTHTHTFIIYKNEHTQELFRWHGFREEVRYSFEAINLRDDRDKRNPVSVSKMTHAGSCFSSLHTHTHTDREEERRSTLLLLLFFSNLIQCLQIERNQ